MDFSRLNAPALSNTSNTGRAEQRDEAAARRVAMEFEALLLNQLTASLNPAGDDEERSLFGNGGGIGLSRQMFSEQIANAMSQAGGIGLSDIILKQLLPGRTDGTQRPDSETGRALAAARSIRDSVTEGIPPTNRNPASPTVSSTGTAKSNALLTTPGVEPYPATTNIAQASAKDTISNPRPASQVSEVVELAPGQAVRPRRVFGNSQTGSLSAATPATDIPDNAEVTKSHGHSIPSILRMFVRGPLKSLFGLRRDPIHGHQRFHKGIDIAAPRGTPIGAAAAGKVVFAGRQGGYGNTVVIEHPDGRRTRYAHADRLFVQTGDNVNTGQAVATVGSTGRSTGPHLHFEVTENGHHLNPLDVLTNDLTLSRR